MSNKNHSHTGNTQMAEGLSKIQKDLKVKPSPKEKGSRKSRHNDRLTFAMQSKKTGIRRHDEFSNVPVFDLTRDNSRFKIDHIYDDDGNLTHVKLVAGCVDKRPNDPLILGEMIVPVEAFAGAVLPFLQEVGGAKDEVAREIESVAVDDPQNPVVVELVINGNSRVVLPSVLDGVQSELGLTRPLTMSEFFIQDGAVKIPMAETLPLDSEKGHHHFDPDAGVYENRTDRKVHVGIYLNAAAGQEVVDTHPDPEVAADGDQGQDEVTTSTVDCTLIEAPDDVAGGFQAPTYDDEEAR